MSIDPFNLWMTKMWDPQALKTVVWAPPPPEGLPDMQPAVDFQDRQRGFLRTFSMPPGRQSTGHDSSSGIPPAQGCNPPERVNKKEAWDGLSGCRFLIDRIRDLGHRRGNTCLMCWFMHQSPPSAHLQGYLVKKELRPGISPALPGRGMG